MKRILIALSTAFILAAGTAHALPSLFELHTWSQGGNDAADVDFSLFDTLTGLGSVSMSFSGGGSYFGGLYVDHELNEELNTAFNEYGGVVGTAPGGLSWQIDEPGFGSVYTGTIYDNFAANALNNRIFDDTFNGPEDVAMAMIRSFDLGIDQSAKLTFTITDTAPDSAFYLLQADGDFSNPAETIYFSSTLRIQGGTEPVPEPSTVILLGAGLLGLGAYARKRRKA